MYRMESFYDMLLTAQFFNKWDSVERYALLLSELLKKEIEVSKQSRCAENRITELLLHKAELERDILKAQLEEILEKFRNPQPPAHKT